MPPVATLRAIKVVLTEHRPHMRRQRQPTPEETGVVEGRRLDSNGCGLVAVRKEATMTTCARGFNCAGGRRKEGWRFLFLIFS